MRRRFFIISFGLFVVQRQKQNTAGNRKAENGKTSAFLILFRCIVQTSRPYLLYIHTATRIHVLVTTSPTVTMDSAVSNGKTIAFAKGIKAFPFVTCTWYFPRHKPALSMSESVWTEQNRNCRRPYKGKQEKKIVLVRWCDLRDSSEIIIEWALKLNTLKWNSHFKSSSKRITEQTPIKLNSSAAAARAHSKHRIENCKLSNKAVHRRSWAAGIEHNKVIYHVNAIPRCNVAWYSVYSYIIIFTSIFSL